jgi:hypothetical protein
MAKSKLKTWPLVTALAAAGVYIPHIASAGPAVSPLRSSSLLQRIEAGLRQQEHVLRNVKVTAKSTSWGWNPAKRSLQETGTTQLTAVWCPGGIFPADVRSIFGGYNPIARRSFSWGEMTYSVAYNGRVGTTYHGKSGRLGLARASRTGAISGHCPRMGQGLTWDSGWCYSIWGLPEMFDWASRDPQHGQYIHATLLQFLEHPPHGAAISAKLTPGYGSRQAVLLTVVWESKDVVRLDPNRNFAVVGDQQFFAVPPKHPGLKASWETRPEDTITVKRFWQPAPGVYYPKRVVGVTYLPSLSWTIPAMKAIMNITRVHLNDPKVSASTFVVHFPRGATVMDGSTGQEIQIAGTPQQQMRAIEKAVASARKEVATQPAVKGRGK